MRSKSQYSWQIRVNFSFAFIRVNWIIKIKWQRTVFGNSATSEHDVTHEDLYNLFPSFESELRKVGVTKLMLWEKYKSEYPQRVQYSQFCEHFNRYFKA